MSLKINLSTKTIIKWSLWAVFGILLLVFFIRVALWEDAYYREKEGSERTEVVSITTDPEEELIEVPPNETEVQEYIVGPKRPRYLTI